MTNRLYEIIESHEENNYLFEIIQSDNQMGVRCRINMSYENLFEKQLEKYEKTKYKSLFEKSLNNRFVKKEIYKFESLVWCWPNDEFNFEIGKKLSKERVDISIRNKINKIKRFIRHLERYNTKTMKYEKGAN